MKALPVFGQGADLDGRVFVVETGPAGKAADDKDVYIFLNGQFFSTGFRLFHGFRPGNFSERLEDDAIVFTAEMVDDQDGILKWEGTVRDDLIEAAFVHQAPTKWYRPAASPKRYWARTARDAPEPLPTGHEVSHLLDGKTFRVRTGARGKPADHEDYLVFWEGKYVSSDCLPYGFGIAAYSTVTEGDAVRFYAETRSPTQGRLIYEGIVRGDDIEATSRWLHQRWFWKIDREYWYQGHLLK